MTLEGVEGRICIKYEQRIAKLGLLALESVAWASPTVLDGRLSTRCRCRSPSTTVI